MQRSAINDHRSLSKGLDRADIHGTYVPVEGPSSPSRADIRGLNPFKDERMIFIGTPTLRPVLVILYRDNDRSGPRSGSDSKVDKLLHLTHLLFDQPVG
jgi:hypothetical protein